MYSLSYHKKKLVGASIPPSTGPLGYTRTPLLPILDPERVLYVYVYVYVYYYNNVCVGGGGQLFASLESDLSLV